MNEKPEALALSQLLLLHADSITDSGVKDMVINSATELAVLHAENEALTATRDRQAAMLRRLEEREAELDAEIGRLRDELRQSSIDYTRAENERLREENRLWYSRAVALFWKCDTDNITVARLQSAAKEIEAALRREEA